MAVCQWAFFSARYFNTPKCDDDPNDLDWTFFFAMDYSRDPDGLRWTSSSARVVLVFNAVYGARLTGYAFEWPEVRLCLGTRGVDLAGGPDHVKVTTQLHYVN
jgi:hypothetical protein